MRNNRFYHILKNASAAMCRIACTIVCIRQKEPRYESRDSSTNIDWPNLVLLSFFQKSRSYSAVTASTDEISPSV